MVQLHGLAPIPAADRIAANSAIRKFGWILEHELKARVIDQFRNVISGDAQLKEQADTDSDPKLRDKFSRYVARKHGELSLGSMLGALKHCRDSSIQTHVEFGRFVEARFPRLLSALADIKTVNDYRDAASHPTRVFDRATALMVANACRTSLDALRPSP